MLGWCGAVVGLQLPAHGPGERLAWGKIGVCTLALQLDIGLAPVDINLYLGLAGGRLGGGEVIELLQQQQTVVEVGEPTLAVGVHLAVLAGFVGLIPCRTIRGGERHETGRGDAVDRRIEENQTLVGHAGNLPWRYLAGCATGIDDGVFHDEGMAAVVGGELFLDAQSQFRRHGTGDDQRVAVALYLIRIFVELLHRGPVPLVLRTRPERAAESLGHRRLRDDFLVVVFQ